MLVRDMGCYRYRAGLPDGGAAVYKNSRAPDEVLNKAELNRARV
jgi:hypothetical protein